MSNRGSAPTDCNAARTPSAFQLKLGFDINLKFLCGCDDLLERIRKKIGIEWYSVCGLRR
jgi:hypothetical protein